MFDWFKKKKTVDENVTLKEIKKILFPSEDIRIEGEYTFYTDFSLDSNLNAALVELEEGCNDEVVRQTIRHVRDELFKIRGIVNIAIEVPSNVNIYQVDNKYRDNTSHISSMSIKEE